MSGTADKPRGQRGPAASEAAKPPRRHRGMTPDERDAARRRRLLDAGLELFGTVGYAASRISDVCRLAHVTQRNFYDHFASREELLLAVYDEIIVDVAGAVVEEVSVERDDPVEQIRAGLRAFVEAMAADERRLRVNFLEVVGTSPTVEARRREAVAGFQALLVSQTQRVIEQGRAPARDVRLTASALAGAVQESLVDWVGRSPRPPLDEVIDELVRIYALALLTP